MIKKILPWVIVLLYVISPYDAIPDFFFGPGWLDDLAVLGLVLWWTWRLKKTTFGAARTSSSGAKTGQAPQGAQQEKEDPYAILGVTPDASDDEIKAAFKKLAAQYHPDKVQHLGEEFQTLAHEKFVAIQQAYNELIQKRTS